jgi:hypothetical protein
VIPGVQPAGRILVVGQDADVAAALHLHLERAGWTLACLPTPDLLDPVLRAVAPHAIVLMLPASPDASWGGALTTAASAARVGMRVVVVAPSRDVVEPLAAVAGAERALARAEVLARPLSVIERAAGAPPAVPQAFPPPIPARAAPPPPPPPAAAPQPSFAAPAAAARAPRGSDVDLMALIDEELVDEPRQRPQLTRVEVNVSLVSEHNFYVGATRRVDSGGVFISTMLPPPVGTHLQVRLGLADGRKVDAEGEVVFVREKSAISGRQPSGCGVKLRGLPGWAIDAIDRFLLARPPIAYAPR